MAYETGSATGVVDLLSKLRTFLAANGWTENRWSAQGSGNWLNVSKSSMYINIVSDPSAGTTNRPGHFLRAYGATSYSSGSAYTAQPNTSGAVIVNGLGTTSLTAYHFFAADDYVYVVIEVTPGYYKHLHFGILTKFGTYTGGWFIFGSSHNYQTSGSNLPNDFYQDHSLPWVASGNSTAADGRGQVRADINGASNKWFNTYYSTTIADRVISGVYGYNTTVNLGQNIMANSPNALNGLTPFFPCMLLAGNSNSLYNPLGYGPGIRAIRMDNLTPGASVTIAGVSWKVFPIYNKPSGGGACYGYAIRYIP